jgi:hypothetical protein
LPTAIFDRNDGFVRKPDVVPLSSVPLIGDNLRAFPPSLRIGIRLLRQFQVLQCNGERLSRRAPRQSRVKP